MPTFTPRAPSAPTNGHTPYSRDLPNTTVAVVAAPAERKLDSRSRRRSNALPPAARFITPLLNCTLDASIRGGEDCSPTTSETSFLLFAEPQQGKRPPPAPEPEFCKMPPTNILCAALKSWLRDLGNQLGGACGALALEAEESIRQLKCRKTTPERLTSIVTDLIASGELNNEEFTWQTAATSLITRLATVIEKHAITSTPNPNPRPIQQPPPVVLRAGIRGPVLQQQQSLVSRVATPAGLRRLDSVVSLPAGVIATNTFTAVVNDDCDDGTTELNQYVLFDKIGSGAQGEVFLASDTTKNELRAVKAVKRPKGASARHSTLPAIATVGAVAAARHRQRDQLEREVVVMKKLRHRNVVRLYEVIDDPAQDLMYLVMQYVEHGPVVSLSAEGIASKVIEPKLMVNYARQICTGLEYLHKKGVIHRDIKPDNILLGRDDCVYLADFGTAEMFSEADAQRGVTGTRGTMAFLAPELVNVQDDTTAALSVSGEAVDVWALGVTFYAMLYGKLPWEFDGARDLFKQIEKSPISYFLSPPDPYTNTHMSRPGHHASQSTTPTCSDEPAPPRVSLRSAVDVDTDDEPLSLTDGLLPALPPCIWREWSRVLGGMLERSPAKRSSICDVRRQLAAMAHNASLSGSSSTPGEEEAITTLRHAFGVPNN
jgi:serine/threonine protein kinase